MIEPLQHLAELISSVLIGDRPVGWLALAAIGILLLLAFRTARSVHKDLDEEDYAIRRCRKHLGSPSDETIEDSTIQDVLEDLPSHSAANRAVEAIWGSRTLANPDVEASLRIAEGGSDPRINRLRAAPNMILLTGLLGTVVGLGSSVASLVPQLRLVLESPEPTALTQSLSVTLAEMQSAFAATIWGIVGALIAGFVVRSVQNHHDEIRSLLRELCVRVLAPKLLPASVEAQIDEISSVLKRSREYLGSVSEIMRESATGFEGVLERTGSVMEANIRDLSQASTSMREALTSLSERIETSVTSLDGAAEGMRASTDELRRYHDDMRNAYADLGKLFQDSRDHTERQTQMQIEKISDVQHEFSSSTATVVERVDTVSERLRETVAAFTKAGERYTDSTNSVNMKLDEGFNRLNERLGVTLEEHRTEMHDVGSTLEHIAAEIKSLVGRLDPSLFPSSEWQEIRKHVSTLADIGRRIADSPSERTVELPVHVTNWFGTDGPLGEVPAQLETALSTLEEIREQLKPSTENDSLPS